MAPPCGDPSVPDRPSDADNPEHGDRSADLWSVDTWLDLNDVLGVVKGVVNTALGVVSWGERLALGLLRARMDVTLPATSTTAPEKSDDHTTKLNTKMNALLNRAVDQSPASGRHDIFDRALNSIVPDEARIIAALSDGDVAPLINIYARTRGGLAGEAVLENMSLVGRAANLVLPALTPMYVGHLLSMALVETAPESPELKDEYEILSADTTVLTAIKSAGRSPLPARVEKRTLRLSRLGQELWATANNQQVT